MSFTKEHLRQEWDRKEGPVVFTTVSSTGEPNSIYVTCNAMNNQGDIVIADNYFKKTKANILQESRAAVLFITTDKKSYQVKGTIHYETAGENFDFMKSWNPVRHPGHAATIIAVEEVYAGGERLL